MSIDFIVTETEGLMAIKTIRAIAGAETTDEEAKEHWDDLLISERERVIEQYRKLKENIH